MPIAQLGQVNVAALNVPQALVQIVPPQYLFGGVPSNIVGHVGTASWGPVGVPTLFGSVSSYAQAFGPTINRLYDMGAQVTLACAQGAGYHYGVRVTDGSDVAASAVIATNCITFTGKYSGSLGNSIKVALQSGSQATSWKVVIYNGYLGTEVFDNIGAGLTANALWVAIASAINNGVSGTRGPSNILIASAGAGITAATAQTLTLTGGTDGVTTITTSVLIGVDTIPRKGIYALRGSKCAVFGVSDLSDPTALGTLDAFAQSIGALAVWSSPSGDTIANASATLSTAGLDDFSVKPIFGDWIVWNDTVNSISQRVSAPTGVSLGKMGGSSPQVSTLNKQLTGIVGTQSTILGKKYEYADFQALATARMDVITNQSPGGTYFSHRLGINASSNQVIQDDSYPRVIYYLAKSIETIAGYYIGQNQTATERRQAKNSLLQFLQLQQDNGIIYQPDGSQAYQVVLDSTNNSATSAALGFQYAYVKAVFGAIVRYFVINLEGGASVTISNSSPTS